MRCNTNNVKPIIGKVCIVHNMIKKKNYHYFKYVGILVWLLEIIIIR